MRHTHLLRRVRRTFTALLVVTLGAVVGVVATPGPASAAGGYSFSAGVLQPGEVKHVWWNNATADAWAVSLQVTRVEAYLGCSVTVERTWYEREASGEREFHLQIRGAAHSPCEVTVWLAALTGFRQSSTGVLAPGGTWSAHWNNAHAEQYVYAVGVVGSQPASGSCRIEVTTHYRTQPDGENEFYYRATNVGVQSCSAELRHVRVPVQWSAETGTLSPGSTRGISPNAFNPVAKVFIPGVVPGANAAGVCRHDISPVTYAENRYFVDYTNNSAVACAMTSTFVGL